jgi:outer membrane protein TolC
LSCSQRLESLDQVPWQYTSYDELLGFSKEIYQQQQKISAKYAQADVSFFIQAKNQSVANGSYSTSFSDFMDDRKEGIAFGISISTALDHRSARSQKVLEEIDKLRYQKEQESILGQMNSYHRQIVSSVKILNEVIVQLHKNSRYLQQSLKEVERKYNQARITFREYIQEQNLLLESNLNEIKTKLEIIHTLLDYFTVFTETKCELNK